MYINLREDVITCLKTFIGQELPEGCFRSGRIEYNQHHNNDMFFNVGFLEEDIQQEIKMNFNKERYEAFKERGLEKYSNVRDYKEWMNKEIEEYKKRVNENVSYKISISQYYWISETKIIATGLKFFSIKHLSSLLANIYFYTDEFGEPNFEDTKNIEWDIDDNSRLIIILPKKTKNGQYFSVLFGEKIFFERTEIWKTNL